MSVELTSSSDAHDMAAIALLYLDGLADDQQCAALNTWLESDPHAMRQFVELSVLHSNLRELGKSSGNDVPSTSFSRHQSGNHQSKRSPSNRFRATQTSRNFRRAAKKRSHPIVFLASAAAACLAVAILAFALINTDRSPSDSSTYVATDVKNTDIKNTDVKNTDVKNTDVKNTDVITAHTGSVAINRFGQSINVAPGMELNVGDVVDVKDGQAEITLRDGSTLALSANTTIVWPSTTQPLTLAKGEFIGEIKPQPKNNPFIAQTEHARITVIGTRFTLQTDTDLSLLAVEHGTVKLSNRNDDNFVLVKDGQIAGTSGKGLLQAMPLDKGLSARAHGLTGDYFDNNNFTAWRLRRTDESINFSWETNTLIAGIIKNTDFSIRWNGFIIPPETATYEFQVHVDDGIRLWIDDQQILNEWGPHDSDRLNESLISAKPIQLQANRPYRIRIEYYQGPVKAKIILNWRYNGNDHVLVPSSCLRPSGWTGDR